MKKIFSNKSYLFILFLILILIVSVRLLFNKTNKNKGDHLISTAEVMSLEQRVTMSGNVQPLQKAIIVAPYSGYIRKIYVKVGDRVKIGAPLVQIAQSLSNLEQSFPLRSPIQGTVVQIAKKEGEFVNQNDLNQFILRIDDMSEVFVKVIAPEIDRFKLKLKQQAHLKPMANNTQQYEAEVVTLSLAAGEKDRWDRSNVVEYEVLLKVLNPDKQLYSGLSTLIDIVTTKRENIIGIGHEYIFKKENQYFVLLEDGSKREIQIGLTNEEFVEVTKGLKQGERVKKVDFTLLVEE